MPFGRLDRWFAPAPTPARVAWLGRTIFAHRGLHGADATENSATAFGAAIDAGLGIECDVQVTADGEAMVFHDWELDRLTDATGPVRDRTSAELAARSLRGSTDRIWSLPALLVEVAGRVPLLIELKSRRDLPYRPLCRAVARALAGYPGQAAVMSFDPRVVRWFALTAPGTVRGLVMTEESDRYWHAGLRRRLWLWRARADFLAYDVRDLPSPFAAAQRARGLPVLTWTVKDAALLERARVHADAPIAEGKGIRAALRDP